MIFIVTLFHILRSFKSSKSIYSPVFCSAIYYSVSSLCPPSHRSPGIWKSVSTFELLVWQSVINTIHSKRFSLKYYFPVDINLHVTVMEGFVPVSAWQRPWGPTQELSCLTSLKDHVPVPCIQSPSPHSNHSLRETSYPGHRPGMDYLGQWWVLGRDWRNQYDFLCRSSLSNFVSQYS